MKRLSFFGQGLLLLLLTVLLAGCTGDLPGEMAAGEVTVSPMTAEPVSAEPSPAGTPPAPANIDTAPITESKHDREPGYMAAFKTRALSVDGFLLQLEDRIYEETLLRSCAEKLRRDLTSASDAVESPPEPVTVYLVERTIDGIPAAVGTHVFCTPEDVETGAYREMLLAAAYNLSRPWQQIGLAEVIFGDEDAASGDAALRAYYTDGTHALTVTCAPVFFTPLLSEEETIRAARQTARSLTAYLLKNEGFSEFCGTGDLSRILPAWQEQIGLPVPLTLPEKSEILSEIELSARSGYLCVLNVRNFSICLSQDSWLVEPAGLCDWLCRFFAGMEPVLERIRSEASSIYEIAVQHFEEPIEIYFAPPTSITIAYPYANQIYLSKDDAIWHEMVHLLLEMALPELRWENEAIAEHFSYPATSHYSPVDYLSNGFDAYLDFFAEESQKEAEADDLIFHRSVWNLYQLFRDPALTEHDDLEASCRAYGISSLLLDGNIRRTQVRKKYDLSVASKVEKQSGAKDADGNALTYPESLAVFEYLAATYGTDAVVKAHIDGIPLEEAFGITYPELFAAAKAYYVTLYADQLVTG